MSTIPGVQSFKVSKFNRSKAKSCTPCRERKKKCDRSSPCSACLRSRTSCYFGDSLTTEESARLLIEFKSDSNQNSTKILPTTPSEISSKASGSQDIFDRTPEHAIDTISTESIDRAFWPSNPYPAAKERVGVVYTNVLNSSVFSSRDRVSPELKTLWQYVPDKKTVDILLDRYRYSVHPVIPIIDLKEVYPKCEYLWNDPSQVDASFFMVFFTILYAASVSEYEELSLGQSLGDSEYAARMKRFVAATEIALAMTDFPSKVTLVGIQSSIILHLVLRNDCRTDDCGSVGHLVRLAQLIELHRDPLKYHGINDPSELQARRLTWWFIFFLDFSTSLSSQVPPVIVQEEFDTMLPSEYTRNSAGKFSLDINIAFANGRFRWAECSNKILRRSASVRGLKPEDVSVFKSEIENLSFHCTSIIQRTLEEHLDAHSKQFVSFCTSVLSTLSDRAQTLLHAAVCQKRPGPLSSVSNPIVEKFDKAIVDMHINVLQQFMIHGSMPENKIFLWEIRKFQPLQNLFFLLKTLVLDLQSRRGVSGDARVDVISNSIQKLGYLSQHTSLLCQERWALLRDLKDQTWPQVCLPEAEQNSAQIDEEDWAHLSEEFKSIQGIIEENMNARIWDDHSGHFL